MKKQIENKIGDDGCTGIFKNSKYLTNLEKLNLASKKFKWK